MTNESSPFPFHTAHPEGFRVPPPHRYIKLSGLSPPSPGNRFPRNSWAGVFVDVSFTNLAFISQRKQERQAWSRNNHRGLVSDYCNVISKFPQENIEVLDDQGEIRIQDYEISTNPGT